VRERERERESLCVCVCVWCWGYDLRPLCLCLTTELLPPAPPRISILKLMKFGHVPYL
jgi:hypothetical protein